MKTVLTVLNPLIFQSFNHLIRNLLISKSPNRLINQSSRHRRAAAKIRADRFKFRLLPGEWQSNPTTQTTRGGGPNAAASGIAKFSVVHPPAKQKDSLSSGGFSVLEESNLLMGEAVGSVRVTVRTFSKAQNTHEHPPWPNAGELVQPGCGPVLADERALAGSAQRIPPLERSERMRANR
jgi:hypothetical protein